MVSKNRLLSDALKNIMGSKERKIASVLLSDNIKIQPTPPPIPEIKVSYVISRDKEEYLRKSGCLEALKELLADIARAVYLDLAQYHRNKGRGALYPMKNIIAEEVKCNAIYGKATPEEFRIIEFKAYKPGAHKLQKKISGLIDHAVKERYAPKNNSEFLKKYHKISNELVANRFVDKKSGDIIYPLEKIEKYLKRRAMEEPRDIKCSYCNRLTYRFHPRSTFCYRESCKSSKSRSDSKKRK